MPRCANFCLAVAILALAAGFGGTLVGAAGFAKANFIAFLVFAVVSLLLLDLPHRAFSTGRRAEVHDD
jgi:uncharacterized membrane protein YtjA (UPF0391 family)